jgi:hypothetical protein
MKRLLLLPLLCAIVFTVHPTTSDAQTCPTGYFNMLDWMNLNTGATQHLTGTSNPQYTVIPANNIFWHIKGDHSGQGYPWDVSYYDANYIYGWITENVWNDPTTFKAQDSKTNKPWTPICVPQGSPGQKLSSITIPSANTGYHFYNPGCVKDSQQHYLGNTVNQVWNYGNLNVGGNVGTHPDLQLSYRYTCDSSYNNCKYKEVYDFMQTYGLVRWTYYILQADGTYQQQNQTIFNDLVSGGAPTPYFPCGLPAN